MDDLTAVGEVIAPPAPMATGTFAIYPTPDGGRVIAYRMADEDESHQIVISGVMMRMWERVQNGERLSPMQMMKEFMGGKG